MQVKKGNVFLIALIGLIVSLQSNSQTQNITSLEQQYVSLQKNIKKVQKYPPKKSSAQERKEARIAAAKIGGAIILLAGTLAGIGGIVYKLLFLSCYKSTYHPLLKQSGTFEKKKTPKPKIKFEETYQENVYNIDDSNIYELTHGKKYTGLKKLPDIQEQKPGQGPREEQASKRYDNGTPLEEPGGHPTVIRKGRTTGVRALHAEIIQHYVDNKISDEDFEFLEEVVAEFKKGKINRLFSELNDLVEEVLSDNTSMQEFDSA